MPTIEFVSIDCAQLPDLPRYDSFAYIAETELHSHRGLFQPIFDRFGGVIVHLANKDLEGHEGGVWFAGKIMDWQNGEALCFLPDTLRDIRDVIYRLTLASPRKRVIFSTDYQFGGEPCELGEINYSGFFELHARQELRYNQLWYVKQDGKDF
jgi:hypothetical protein